MKSSTRDKVEGTAKDLKGRAKEAQGDLTDRPMKKMEGMADEAAGKFQKKTGEIKRDFGR